MGVSREKVTAMLDVLKTRWQTKGWHVMAKEDGEPMALEFIRELDRHGVPWTAYRDLYHRSVDLRARRLGQGMQCEDFSAEMMIACWPALEAELKQREIDAGRTLTENAASQCPRCHGTDMEALYGASGYQLGVRKGCDHRAVEEGEGLAIHLERLKKAARPRVIPSGAFES